MIIDLNRSALFYILTAKKLFQQKKYTGCLDCISLAVERADLDYEVLLSASKMLSSLNCFEESNFLLHLLELNAKQDQDVYELLIQNFDALNKIEQFNYYSEKNIVDFFDSQDENEIESDEQLDELNDLKSAYSDMRDVDFRKEFFSVYDKTSKTMIPYPNYYEIHLAKKKEKQEYNAKFESYVLCRIAEKKIQEKTYTQAYEALVSASRLSDEYLEPIATLLQYYDIFLAFADDLKNVVNTILKRIYPKRFEELQIIFNDICQIVSSDKSAFFATIRELLPRYYSLESGGFGYTAKFLWLKAALASNIEMPLSEFEYVKTVTSRFSYIYPKELYQNYYPHKGVSSLPFGSYLPSGLLNVLGKNYMKYTLSYGKCQRMSNCLWFRLLIRQVFMDFHYEKGGIPMCYLNVFSNLNCLDSNEELESSLKYLMQSNMTREMMFELLLLYVQFIDKAKSELILVDDMVVAVSVQPVKFLKNLSKRELYVFCRCAILPCLFGHNIFNEVVRLFKNNEIADFLSKGKYNNDCRKILENFIAPDNLNHYDDIERILEFELKN